MKRYIACLSFMLAVPAQALTDNVRNQLLDIDVPYAITHLERLKLDCLWILHESGNLESRAEGPDGSGACWSQESVDQADALKKANKLVWHAPPSFDYEYGDKRTCYLEIDKGLGLARQVYTGNSSDEDRASCRERAKDPEVIALAKRKEVTVSFGGYTARKNDIVGTVVLACYTGSLDSNSPLVPVSEQLRRFSALMDMHKGDSQKQHRIEQAYQFARTNLSNRYPLDSRGQFRASVCDQMMLEGKL